MLKPSCGNRRLPSKLQNEPSGPSLRQRESRALSTNQPSPSTTRPFLVMRGAASGTTRQSLTEAVLLALALAGAARSAAAGAAAACLLLHPLGLPAHLTIGGVGHAALLLRRFHVRPALGGCEAAHRLLHGLRVRVGGDRIDLLDRARELGVLALDRLRADAREEPAHEADPRKPRDDRPQQRAVPEPAEEDEQAEEDEDDAD